LPAPPRWLAPALFLVLLAAFAAGIWGSYRAVFPAKGLYRVTGIFQSRASDTLILVRHEAVPGLMEEMSSMAFFVESKDLLDRADLRPGDRVRFTIRQVPDRLLVVEMQKIR
jgi:Copper binding periplasmic protein CusF